MKSTNKWQDGPGGMRCPCCRMGSLRQAKRGHNRAERRRGRREIAREEEEE